MVACFCFLPFERFIQIHPLDIFNFFLLPKFESFVFDSPLLNIMVQNIH